MSTHNIAFYEEISKIITIITKYHQIRTLFLLLSETKNFKCVNARLCGSAVDLRFMFRVCKSAVLTWRLNYLIRSYIFICPLTTVPAPFFCPKTRFGLVFTTFSFRFGFVLVWFRFLALSVF